jgi:hypothetical protein
MHGGLPMMAETPVRPLPAPPPPLLPTAEVAPHAVAAGWPPMWWVGCHGGAGSTTLARLTGMGGDLGLGWPHVDPAWAIQPVVLVARATASGTLAAAGAIEQWRRRSVPGVRVLGLVVVAASPRRAPRIAVERVQLLGGWVPHLWRVGWVDALLATENAREVGTPPDVEALRVALMRALNSEVGTP